MRIQSGCKNLNNSNVYLYLMDKLGKTKSFKYFSDKCRKIKWVHNNNTTIYVVDRVGEWKDKSKRMNDIRYRDLK